MFNKKSRSSTQLPGTKHGLTPRKASPMYQRETQVNIDHKQTAIPAAIRLRPYIMGTPPLAQPMAVSGNSDQNSIKGKVSKKRNRTKVIKVEYD